MTSTGWTTKQLRKAKRDGAVILAGPTEVDFKPRREGDPTPWRVSAAGQRTRYRPGQCHPEGPNGGPWILVELLQL